MLPTPNVNADEFCHSFYYFLSYIYLGDTVREILQTDTRERSEIQKSRIFNENLASKGTGYMQKFCNVSVRIIQCSHRVFIIQKMGRM